MKKIEFHFKGGSADRYELPVDCMINLLSNMQQLMYLIAAQSQDLSYTSRFKPSKKIRENYIIKCELPEKGSYVQALAFDYVGQELQFNPVENKIEEVLQWVADANEPKIIHLFPTPKMRARALSCVRNALPPSDSQIYAEVKVANGNTVLDSRPIQKNITTIIDKTQIEVEQYMTVVTGRLVSINFDERKIVINHPITRRNLDCFYNEDVEDLLFDNRRELVQITGMVVLDDNEQPKQITDVVSIQEIDLSPIEIDDVNWNEKKLHFKNKLILTPQLDDTEQLYTINKPDIGLNLFAFTRQELTDDVKSDIIYLWEEYALASDSELTHDAQALKSNLINMIEEI